MSDRVQAYLDAVEEWDGACERGGLTAEASDAWDERLDALWAALTAGEQAEAERRWAKRKGRKEE